MRREQWQSVKDKIESLLEVDATERPAYLDRIAGDDRELRRELESLLFSKEKMADDFLDLPVYSGQESLLPASSVIGKRLGPYEIVAEIDQGGMGEVYRALRADDQYQKEVAIKLIRACRESAFVISRFKNERQILANLEHPNIARLLDGGSTPEGVPYLVMELLEGESIVEYCDRHELGIIARLELFRQVCSAVQFAHQRLIIHRDIKPGNILVTAEGVPKLLDFGISKILWFETESGGSDQTATDVRMLTPAYASPEQVKGEPITTASDVYSLGVVLYELLAGRHPYRSDRGSDQILREICESEPEKPSTAVKKTGGLRESGQSGSSPRVTIAMGEKLSKHLRGDLDNIVLMAMRKEPQRRYASAEQFAEDIRRYLGNLPVNARKDTATYRVSKFVTRHKAAVTAASVVVITLLAALIITLHEARIARLQQARAERRFNDVRKLANSLIFTVHDSIANVPGTTGARKLIVQQGLEYLDNLSQESANDTRLQKELATGYEKLGDAQIGRVLGNVGDTAGGLASYRKAVGIREELARRQLNDPVIQLDLAKSYRNLASALDNAGDQKQSDEYIGKARQIVVTLANKYPNNPDIHYNLGSCDWQRGGAFLRDGDLEAALRMYKESADQFDRAEALDPSNRRAHRAVAIADKNIGNILEKMQKPDEALPYYRQASDIDERSLKQEPENSMYVRDNTIDLRNIGDILFKQGKFQEARTNYEEALAMDRHLVEKDSSDRDTEEYLAHDYEDLGKALVGMGNGSAAIAALQNALRIHVERVKADPNDALARNNFAESYVRLGDAYATIGNSGTPSRPGRENSCSAYDHALELWNAMEKEGKLYKLFETHRSNLLTKMTHCRTVPASLSSIPPT